MGRKPTVFSTIGAAMDWIPLGNNRTTRRASIWPGMSSNASMTSTTAIATSADGWRRPCRAKANRRFFGLRMVCFSMHAMRLRRIYGTRDQNVPRPDKRRTEYWEERFRKDQERRAAAWEAGRRALRGESQAEHGLGDRSRDPPCP